MASSQRSSAQLWAACSAAFAAGAAAGAWAMRYYLAPPSSAATAAAPGPWAGGGARAVPSLNLAALQSLPGSGQSSGALSPAPSVSSYSVPPTPRLSTSGSMNGRPGGDSGLVMVFVVRRDLGWGRQKLAVMAAHAALALFKKLYKSRNPALMQWELAKGPKLVLRADGEAQLLAVLDAARASGLPHHCIAEAELAAAAAGKPGATASSSSSTQAGSGSDVGGPDVPRRSRTMLALGPLPAADIPQLAPGMVLL